MGPNGPVPITVEAMDAYARMSNRVEAVYREQLLNLVPVLDRIYLKDYYDKQREEIEKQRRKSGSGSPDGAPRSGVGGTRRTTSQRRRR